MANRILTERTKKAIRDNADTYAEVAKATKSAPTYLAILLRKNDKRFTTLDNLELISSLTGIPQNELTAEVEPEPSIAQ